MDNLNKIIIIFFSIGLLAGFLLGLSIGIIYEKEKIINIIEKDGIFRIDEKIYIVGLTNYSIYDEIKLENNSIYIKEKDKYGNK